MVGLASSFLQRTLDDGPFQVHILSQIASPEGGAVEVPPGWSVGPRGFSRTTLRGLGFTPGHAVSPMRGETQWAPFFVSKTSKSAAESISVG
jgi:hypothetical protein